MRQIPFEENLSVHGHADAHFPVNSHITSWHWRPGVEFNVDIRQLSAVNVELQVQDDVVAQATLLSLLRPRSFRRSHQRMLNDLAATVKALASGGCMPPGFFWNGVVVPCASRVGVRVFTDHGDLPMLDLRCVLVGVELRN